MQLERALGPMQALEPAPSFIYLLFKDIIIPLVGPAVTSVLVVFGFWQYRRTSQRDFIQPLRQAQLDLYREACSAAALVATLPKDGAPWKKSRAEFLRLYYGPLAIVEDFDHQPGGDRLTVERAMILFKRCLDDQPQCDQFDSSLATLSLALAHACRESLGRTWGHDLAQLKGTYHERALEYARRLEKFDRSQHAKKQIENPQSA
jgi:hypothetical protein